jgi:chemotaxis protein CheC
MKPEPFVLDAIQELINIGVGNSAAMLAELTHSRIKLYVPDVRLLRLSEISNEPDFMVKQPMATVYLEFSGEFSGKTALMIPPESAANLVNLILQDSYEAEELDAVMVDTLKEVANIIVNGVMGSISNVLKEHLTYTIPTYHLSAIMTLIEQSGWDDKKEIILANTMFQVQNSNIAGKIIMILDIGALEILIDKIKEGNSGFA